MKLSSKQIRIVENESGFHTILQTEKISRAGMAFPVVQPTFLCVPAWNLIGTIKYSAKTFGLILLETVLVQCGRFRRSWRSRQKGTTSLLTRSSQIRLRLLPALHACGFLVRDFSRKIDSQHSCVRGAVLLCTVLSFFLDGAGLSCHTMFK